MNPEINVNNTEPKAADIPIISEAKVIDNVSTESPVTPPRKKFLFVVAGVLVTTFLIVVIFTVTTILNTKEMGDPLGQQSNTPLPTAVVLKNNDTSTEIDVICPTGFKQYLSNKFFNVCYPDSMKSSTLISDSDFRPGLETSVTIFEDESEKFVISTTFQGGWGGGTCGDEKVTVAENEALILMWNANEQTACTSDFTNLVALIKGEDSNDVFPIAVDYQQKGNKYLDKGKFDTLLSTLKVK